MYYRLMVFLFVLAFFIIVPTAVAITPEVRTEALPGMVDGWLDKARAFRFVNILLRVNQEEEEVPPKLKAIIQPYMAQFMTKDEADALFRAVRKYYKEEKKISEGVSLLLRSEVFIIDIVR